MSQESVVKDQKRQESESQRVFDTATKLHDEGKFAEAEALLREVLDQDPGNIVLQNALGVMLSAMKRHHEAVRCFRDVLAVDATAVGVWTNLGNALTQLQKLKSAVACQRRAISLSRKPDPLLYRNLGTSLAEAGQYSEAIVAFSQSINLKPDYHSARLDRALSYLFLGNFVQGWADYEIRKLSGQLSARSVPGVEWDGKPYPGKRLLIVGEQGFGDMLWVARYFSRVKALGGELIIECRPELVSLIASMGIADKVVTPSAVLPEADLHCFLCSLPGFFTPDILSIPNLPYLTVPPTRLRKFASLLNAKDKLKVGIVWSGNVNFGRNHRRAQRLSGFLQACALPGVQLFSLQKGPPSSELASSSEGAAVVDLDLHLKDFADTAAAIANLDLVIMTDSAVAHLAGAMGKPIWVLLGHSAHWLWLLDRSDSPWYPSMRLFRPRAEGDWDHVFDSVSAELMVLSEKYQNVPRL